jgi:TonB dependent receptor/Carboxypeptidase regulatory-like domain
LSSCRGFGWAVVASTILSPLTSPQARGDEGGGLVGWVESTRGVPVAGALVSIFGKGIRGGSLVTLADGQGQFVLPTLPAGSYTLRAIGSGHEPSAARHVTVLPNRDALYTLSLTPVGEKAQAAQAAESDQATSQAEWRWLVRHKRRSVLETSGPDLPDTDDAPALTLDTVAPRALDGFDGSVELAATGGSGGGVPDASGLGLPAGVGSLQLHGRLTEGVAWTLGGLMSESEGRAWRVAAEFVLEPGSGHEIEVGAGYGAGDSREAFGIGLSEPARTLGAVFVRDRWRIGERLRATAGARYTYLGFLPDSNHADAVVEVELQGDSETVVRGSFATRTLTPGGDLLTLSTVAASPGITWARLDEDLRPGRALRFEVGVTRALGPSAHVGAQLFSESTHDALLTVFEDGAPFVRNAGTLAAKGFGVTVGRRFGRVVDGSVTYTFGQGRRASATALAAVAPMTAFEEAEFHDLAARVETFIGWSDTRVAAQCRLNALSDSGASLATGSRAVSTSTRFDVQLTQGLPFLAPLTRADWELLLAVRNMFYEASQAGFLDELAVQGPPTRVVGGISVRF